MKTEYNDLQNRTWETYQMVKVGHFIISPNILYAHPEFDGSNRCEKSCEGGKRLRLMWQKGQFKKKKKKIKKKKDIKRAPWRGRVQQHRFRF